jgi:hypothetical protein
MVPNTIFVNSPWALTVTTNESRVDPTVFRLQLFFGSKPDPDFDKTVNFTAFGSTMIAYLSEGFVASGGEKQFSQAG